MFQFMQLSLFRKIYYKVLILYGNFVSKETKFLHQKIHHKHLVAFFPSRDWKKYLMVLVFIYKFPDILKVIEKESAVAEEQREIVAEDEAVANQQAGESQALKDECEADLAEAIPALEAALSALNTLKVNMLLKTFLISLVAAQICKY